MQLTADPAAFDFLDVQHVLGQAADLLFALSQILHQPGFFGRHQTALGGGGQQFLLARQPFISLRESKLHHAGGATVRSQWDRPAGGKLAVPAFL